MMSSILSNSSGRQFVKILDSCVFKESVSVGHRASSGGWLQTVRVWQRFESEVQKGWVCGVSTWFRVSKDQSQQGALCLDNVMVLMGILIRYGCHQRCCLFEH